MTAGFVRNLRRFMPRRERPTQRVALLLAVITLVLGTAWSILDDNNHVKVAGVVIIVIVLSSLMLSVNGMLALLGLVALCLTTVFRVHGLNSAQLSPSGFVMVVVTGVVGVLQARRRDALGLKEVSAETVIGLIRERLLVQAQLPSVPDGWTVEIEQRPADGAAISGDFVSTRLVNTPTGQQLHLAVIDVSGSGITAGPRALLLSGAVGGLLGSVPPEEFLPAANSYLARQQWSLGFASAIYVLLDLDTGEYAVRVAGHPPAVHFRPHQAPVWRTSTATGTVLGVLPTLTGQVDWDVLRPGDALILYTDGVVEDRTRDIDTGTGRLKDGVELQAAQGNWPGIARYLIERVPTQAVDDRTVVLIRRHPVPARSLPSDPAGSAGPADQPDQGAAAGSQRDVAGLRPLG
ncbi:MAG TPA: PP2C family protein-serine/threonine phosphatase [Jatrophihabitans sp.]|nr:PP2C family protein-serine/threonine phosphatase [Jatrophihabitans sp.]